jgi:hypothetical protein
LFFLSILSLIAACNNATQEKKSSGGDTAAAAKSEVQTSSAIPGLIGGTLDTLFVVSDSFAKLPNKKIVFAFTFKQNDTLTLDGWALQNNGAFNDNPDIQLLKYNPSGYSYGNGMYFGNVVLQNGDVQKIQNQLKQLNGKTVLFAPKLVNTTHIGYEILISTETIGGSRKALNSTSTGVDANPSPPKGY